MPILKIVSYGVAAAAAGMLVITFLASGEILMRS